MKILEAAVGRIEGEWVACMLGVLEALLVGRIENE